MGGLISVESEVGEWSEFCFTLPLIVSRATPPISNRYSRLAQTKVVLVTDDPSSTLLMTRVVEGSYVYGRAR